MRSAKVIIYDQIAGMLEETDNGYRFTSYKRFRKAIPLWKEFIMISFLPEDIKAACLQLIDERAGRLFLLRA